MINLFKLISRFSTQQKVPLSLPTFKEYQFHKTVMEVLNTQQLFTPSPIQDLTFTELTKRQYKNFVLIAPTGTGKTLAYAIPLIDALKKEELRADAKLTEPLRVRSLVVVPSKELVDQVTEVCKGFAHVVKLKCLGLTGAQKFKVEKDILQDSGVDIAVGTIDRLLKHKEHKSLFITKLKYLVIDEVDTLIDSGNEEYLGELCRAVIKRQNESDEDLVPTILLVGATCTGKFERFAEQIFGKDIKYIIEKNSHMHLENLSHEFIHCTTLDKTAPLLKLMAEINNKYEGLLIFCNSISSCQFLERTLLENKINAVSLHGSIPLNMRIQNVQMFRGRQIKVMVATDLAARGLDFPFLTHVINFDFPQSTSDYLHRAGRTGRAGRKGHIISLYHNRDEEVINELKASNDNNTALNIKGSSYSKINREMMSQSRPRAAREPQPDRMNSSKRLGLPGGYLEMRSKQQSSSKSSKVLGYKPLQRGKSTEGSQSHHSSESKGRSFQGKTSSKTGYQGRKP